MHVVVWKTRAALYALDTQHVVEIVPLVTARPVPRMPAWLRGLVVYRDALLPLVDAAALLGHAPAEERRANRIIIVRLHAASPDNERIGLLVEDLVGADHIDFTARSAPYEFVTADGAALGLVAQTEYGLVQLIEPSSVFTAEQRVTLRQTWEAAEG